MMARSTCGDFISPRGRGRRTGDWSGDTSKCWIKRATRRRRFASWRNASTANGTAPNRGSYSAASFQRAARRGKRPKLWNRRKRTMSTSRSIRTCRSPDGKFEYRNPKQFSKQKKYSKRRFEASDLIHSKFVSRFEIRISDFFDECRQI